MMQEKTTPRDHVGDHVRVRYDTYIDRHTPVYLTPFSWLLHHLVGTHRSGRCGTEPCDCAETSQIYPRGRAGTDWSVLKVAQHTASWETHALGIDLIFVSQTTEFCFFVRFFPSDGWMDRRMDGISTPEKNLK